eukprot:2301500-Alexandrium_andersonii.AAC.1
MCIRDRAACPPPPRIFGGKAPAKTPPRGGCAPWRALFRGDLAPRTHDQADHSSGVRGEGPEKPPLGDPHGTG